MLYETVNISISHYPMEWNLDISRRLGSLRKWFRKNHDSLILFCGVLTVGILGFEAGFIHGMSKNQEPLRIELAPEEVANTTGQATHVQGESGQRVGATVGDTRSLQQGTCAFVASRNSKLFHAATCAVVKRIKPENKLCFQEKGEAEARGLKQGCMK